MDIILMTAIVAFGAGWMIRNAITTEGDAADSVDQFLDQRRVELQDRYTTTQMDYVEFGDRAAVLEAPGTARIMRDAVTVDGIGVETAFAIAQTFDGDYEAYRAADRDGLERVNGVGENRVTALLNQ